MTDLTAIAPVRSRRAVDFAQATPKFSIPMLFATLAQAYGHALGMAYVEPYRRDGHSAASFEGSEDGRNPEW
ncbi:hypothetical protein [Aestuariivirga sp.]|uniref:hypothetical protein n=1 Tax=Aestuariivirga sp. TaxID=2650926 RepID=UPI003919DA49